MKKLLLVLLAMVIMLFSVPVFAMGPLMLNAHIAAWDREADTTVTGYYIYWRTVGGTAWPTTQRSPAILQPAVGVVPTFDLTILNLPNGSYEICATAYSMTGESGASNIVPFQVSIPASPANLKV